MKFQLEINIDNDAFTNGTDELQRILTSVVRILKDEDTPPEPSDGRIALRDVNGNTVGFFQTVED